jgi:hypothetical protein
MKISKDPVKYCKLYKKEGCSHVNGFLCDYEKCTMRMEFELFELEQQLDIPQHLRYHNRKETKCT